MRRSAGHGDQGDRCGLGKEQASDLLRGCQTQLDLMRRLEPLSETTGRVGNEEPSTSEQRSSTSRSRTAALGNEEHADGRRGHSRLGADLSPASDAPKRRARSQQNSLGSEAELGVDGAKSYDSRSLLDGKNKSTLAGGCY